MIQAVESELRECASLVQEADRLAAAAGAADGDMASEYRALYDDVRARLVVAREDLTENIAVQVNFVDFALPVVIFEV